MTVKKYKILILRLTPLKTLGERFHEKTPFFEWFWGVARITLTISIRVKK